MVILPCLYAAAQLLIVWFSVVSSAPYFLVFLCDSYRIIALISLGCSFAPFLVSLFNSHQQPLHTLLLVPLFHLYLCFCVMVTKNHYELCCWFLCPTFPCVSVWWLLTTIMYFVVGFSVPLLLVSLCDEHQQPLSINVTVIVNVTQNYIFWCFLICHTFLWLYVMVTNNHYVFCCWILCPTCHGSKCDDY